jgi:hypothetical protein
MIHVTAHAIHVTATMLHCAKQQYLGYCSLIVHYVIDVGVVIVVFVTTGCRQRVPLKLLVLP